MSNQINQYNCPLITAHSVSRLRSRSVAVSLRLQAGSALPPCLRLSQAAGRQCSAAHRSEESRLCARSARICRRRHRVADYARPGRRLQRSRHGCPLHRATHGAVVHLVGVHAVGIKLRNGQPGGNPGKEPRRTRCPRRPPPLLPLPLRPSRCGGAPGGASCPAPSFRPPAAAPRPEGRSGERTAPPRPSGRQTAAGSPTGRRRTAGPRNHCHQNDCGVRGVKHSQATEKPPDVVGHRLSDAGGVIARVVWGRPGGEVVTTERHHNRVGGRTTAGGGIQPAPQNDRQQAGDVRHWPCGGWVQREHWATSLAWVSPRQTTLRVRSPPPPPGSHRSLPRPRSKRLEAPATACRAPITAFSAAGIRSKFSRRHLGANSFVTSRRSRRALNISQKPERSAADRCSLGTTVMTTTVALKASRSFKQAITCQIKANSSIAQFRNERICSPTNAVCNNGGGGHK